MPKKKDDIETRQETVDTEPAEKTDKNEETIVENVMYLGPSIDGLISHSTVYTDGILPDSVTNAIAEFPLMGHLFVPLSKVPDTYRILSKRNNINVTSKKVDKYFNGGKK